MPGMSLSLASQMAQAFRFLGLVKPDGCATPDLKLIAQQPESLPVVLPKLFRQSYPELFAPGTAALSEKVLEQRIAQTGLSAATQRKAVTFALNAASYMKLPVDRKGPKESEPGPALSREPALATGRAPSSTRSSLSIDLLSGGSVEISVDLDLVNMDKVDREFVFDLIDKARSYRDDRRRERKRDLESGLERETIFRGDQEVPF